MTTTKTTSKKKVTKETKASRPIATKKPAGKYIFAVGRRKTAIARVKLWSEGTGDIVVNSRFWQEYFPTESLQQLLAAPLEALGTTKSVNIVALVSGGGVVSQAKAVALGIARAFVSRDEASKTVLKKQGLLTRDSRKKERKKPGLKRARRAPQWQKR